jgi:LysM repeat protein
MAEVTLRVRFNGTRLIVFGGLVLAIAAVRRLVSRQRVFEAPLPEPEDEPTTPTDAALAAPALLTAPSPEIVEEAALTAPPVFVMGPRPVKDATKNPTKGRRSRRRSAKVEVLLALIVAGAYAGVFGASYAGGDAPDLLHLRSYGPAADAAVSEVLAVNQTSAIATAGDAPAPYPTVDPAGAMSSEPASEPAPLPAPSPEPTPAGPPTHVLQRGETLTSVAGLYGVSIQEIAAANHLTTDLIYAGQTLLIPRP